MKYFLILISFVFVSCNTEVPTQFSKEALSDKIMTLDKTEISFKDVLKKYEGKTVLIDFWASWCGDCIRGLPKVVALQKEYKDISYVFISVDGTRGDWLSGIKRYRIQGDHYLLPSGTGGELGDFIDLDWIPRYMVIEKDGSIKLFKAVKANDKRIIEALKK